VMERISLADSDADRIQNWDEVKNKIGGDMKVLKL
jgi:hypothetical protein